MAFNKDRSVLSGMNLRQQMRRSGQRPPKSTGGGGAPHYLNQYQPPKNGSSDLIRLLPGQYKIPRVDMEARDFVRDQNGQIVMDTYPFFKYTSYYNHVKKRGCVGSEGPLGMFKGKGEPCIAADWFWWEWRERQRTGNKDRPKSMRRSDSHVFSVLVMSPFYKVPQTDKNTGAIKVNPNTKEPYYNWVKGSRRGNDEFAAAGYAKKDGHVQHWSLGNAHWQTLFEYGDSLANHCRACRGQNTIREVALLCRHCGEAVVEFETTSLSEEDLRNMRDDEVLCSHCRAHNYLEDVIACTNCRHPERATLFDFDLEVRRVASAGSDSNQTVLMISKAIGPKPIDPIYGEDARKPLDLPKIFAPTPLADQERLFGLPPADGDDSSSTVRQPVNTGTPQNGPQEDEGDEESEEEGDID